MVLYEWDVCLSVCMRFVAKCFIYHDISLVVFLALSLWPCLCFMLQRQFVKCGTPISRTVLLFSIGPKNTTTRNVLNGAPYPNMCSCLLLLLMVCSFTVKPSFAILCTTPIAYYFIFQLKAKHLRSVYAVRNISCVSVALLIIQLALSLQQCMKTVNDTNKRIQKQHKNRKQEYRFAINI